MRALVCQLVRDHRYRNHSFFPISVDLILYKAFPVYSNKDFFIYIQLSFERRFKPGYIGDRHFSAVYHDSELLHRNRSSGALSNTNEARSCYMAVDDISILNVSQKFTGATDV